MDVFSIELYRALVPAPKVGRSTRVGVLRAQL